MPTASKVKSVPRANRSRSNAEKRITLSTLVEGGATDDPTLDTILNAMGPFIAGTIETLGMAAQPVQNPDGSSTPGDTQAAKTVLDFLGKALSNRGDRHSQEVLQKIANLRKGGLDAALAEEDTELADS